MHYHLLVFFLQLSGSAWEQLPVGVVQRDVLLPSQDARRHLRKPRTSEQMRARRQQLAESLTARSVGLKRSSASVRARSKKDDGERERNSKHVEQFVSALETAWNDFQWFAGESAFITW